MRLALTTATLHGEKNPKVITGPEMSVLDQQAAFKRLAGAPEHAQYAEVQLWLSDVGITRKIRLRAPERASAKSKKKE